LALNAWKLLYHGTCGSCLNPSCQRMCFLRSRCYDIKRITLKVVWQYHETADESEWILVLSGENTRHRRMTLILSLSASSVSLWFLPPRLPCSVSNTLLKSGSPPIAPPAIVCYLSVSVFVRHHPVWTTASARSAAVFSPRCSPFTEVGVAAETNRSTDERPRAERQDGGHDQPRVSTSTADLVQSSRHQQAPVVSPTATAAASSPRRSVNHAGHLQARTVSGRCAVQEEHGTSLRRQWRRRLGHLVELGGLGSQQFETGTGTNVSRRTDLGNCYNTALTADALMTEQNQTRSVAAGLGRHGIPPPASNDTGTALDQDGSDWSCDLSTLTFDLGGHGTCGWCGLSSSIRTPSLKFVSLAVQKIWRTMCVSSNGPGDLDVWPFDLASGMRVAAKAGNLLSKFRHARPSDSRIIRYVRDGRTDGQEQRLLPLP